MSFVRLLSGDCAAVRFRDAAALLMFTSLRRFLSDRSLAEIARFCGDFEICFEKTSSHEISVANEQCDNFESVIDSVSRSVYKFFKKFISELSFSLSASAQVN